MVNRNHPSSKQKPGAYTGPRPFVQMGVPGSSHWICAPRGPVRVKIPQDPIYMMGQGNVHTAVSCLGPTTYDRVSDEFAAAGVDPQRVPVMHPGSAEMGSLPPTIDSWAQTVFRLIQTYETYHMSCVAREAELRARGQGRRSM